MNQGVKTIIYPVKDISRSKALFRTLLGVDPYVEQPYYVGFKIGDQDIGLDPNGHKAGMTCYYHVDNIKESLQSLVDAGAQVEQPVKNVGGGKLTAIVREEGGSLIGLIQVA
ncbi:MAG TPA: VOC family protein [Bacteroidota bacterium]|nr:VOC family protein [Bacteroidota bacterium]